MCLGIPGRIVEISNARDKLAMVEIGGIRRQVNLVCIVDEAHPLESCVGDWVLIHVGFAMSRIDEEQATRTLELLTRLGEIQEELSAPRSPAAGK